MLLPQGIMGRHYLLTSVTDAPVSYAEWGSPFSFLPGYGMMTDGTTTFVNASACTVNFLPMNPPIVIDLPNPRTTWLEEACSKMPAANQEKGARRGRWGRQAQQVELCKYTVPHIQHTPRDGADKPRGGSSRQLSVFFFFFCAPHFFIPKADMGQQRAADKVSLTFNADVSVSFTALTIWWLALYETLGCPLFILLI